MNTRTLKVLLSGTAAFLAVTLFFSGCKTEEDYKKEHDEKIPEFFAFMTNNEDSKKTSKSLTMNTAMSFIYSEVDSYRDRASKIKAISYSDLFELQYEKGDPNGTFGKRRDKVLEFIKEKQNRIRLLNFTSKKENRSEKLLALEEIESLFEECQAIIQENAGDDDHLYYLLLKELDKGSKSKKGISALEYDFLQAHSFSRLIPPGVKNRNSYLQNKALPFVKDKKYFVTNPEWFSMDEKGKRVPDRQLCFTNAELKKELEKNIVTYFNAEKKRSGINGIIELSANDVYNRICCCKPCVALDDEYGVRGMAMLLAICEIAERNPQIPFRAMAYQRGQSLIPPKKAVKWPKNLALIFAPINGDFANPLTSKENTIEYNAIKGWRKYTSDILFWYYPNPYNRQRDKYLDLPPTFMTDRLSTDYKLMRDLGIAGFYTEHDSGGIYLCTNFSELQTYIMFKLMQNPDCDTEKLARYFIKHYYGPAAKHVQEYYDALAKEMRAFTKKGGTWYYNTADYPFLNPVNMKRFDAMLNAAEKAADGEYASRVRMLRIAFDSTYVAVVPADHKARLDKIEKSLQEVISKRKLNFKMSRFQDWKKELSIGANAKKLPPELANISPDYLLDFFAPSKGATIVKDPDANLGRAFAEKWTRQKPFTLGTYDSQSKKYGAGLGITPKMIKGEGFHFYTFPRTVKLTSSMILFGGSWNLNFRIGGRVYHDDANISDKEYLVHVSLKFEKDRVLCDRVVLQEKVKLPPKALPENLAKLPASDVIVVEAPESAKNLMSCSDGSCGKALYEKIDTKKAAYGFGVYNQKAKNYGSSSLGINYKTAKKGEFKLYTLPRPGILHADSILFGGRWHVIFPIGKAVAAKGADALKKKWQIIVSMKITENNEVFVDRVILVAKP